MFETQLLEEAPKVEIKQELTKEEIIDCLKHYKYAPKNTNVRPKHLWNDYYRINCFKKVNNDNENVKSSSRELESSFGLERTNIFI